MKIFLQCHTVGLPRHKFYDRLDAVMRPLAVFLGILSCFLLVQCGDGSNTAEKFAKENILLIGNNSEPQSLDPHKATAVADGKIISTLLEGLVRPNPEDESGVLPGAAESWEHSENAQEWTFHLYKDGVWSDGTPLTAHDFVYAYKRILHPEFGGKYAEMLYPIKGAEAFNKGVSDWSEVGVKALDDYTLRISLNGPTPHLPQLLLHFTWFPIPKHHVENNGGMLDRRSRWSKPDNWVGNGAYVTDEHRINNYLSVKPNPKYFTEVVEKFNLDPAETVVIGNDLSDDAAAKAAGLTLVIVTDWIVNGDRPNVADYTVRAHELPALIQTLIEQN